LAPGHASIYLLAAFQALVLLDFTASNRLVRSSSDILSVVEQLFSVEILTQTTSFIKDKSALYIQEAVRHNSFFT